MVGRRLVHYLESRGVRVVNGVPWEVPRPTPEGPQAPRVLAAGLPRGTPLTTLHPRLFHIMSFFDHPGLVTRDFLHYRQTQPVPREDHTQCYVVEVQTLVELNPNILVRQFQRMQFILWIDVPSLYMQLKYDSLLSVYRYTCNIPAVYSNLVFV